MVLLELFYVFFTIGLFTIGGGYAMIPMIEAEVIGRGWITQEQLITFLAISESTPGPFAINIATFIGEGHYGIIGAFVATIAVVLPSFIIMLLILKVFKKFSDNKYVNYLLKAMKAVIIGLIFYVACKLVYSAVFPNGIENKDIDYKAVIILPIIFIISKIKIKGKKINPIYLILISCVLGIVLYGLL